MGEPLEHQIESVVDSVPAGAWAVGVSGGADSTALLCIATKRSDLQLHVVHLNHETRGDESDGDARFVEALSRRFNLPFTIARRGEIESTLSPLPTNPSARFRRLRHHLFASVVEQHSLRGVLLAHHAGDQAETILQRLLRGSGWAGLAGMSDENIIRGVSYRRPFLNLRPELLRQYLQTIAQPWREDASNALGKYQRNRVRKWLQQNPELSAALIDLALSARTMRSWAMRNAPALPEAFDVRLVADLPNILRRWAVADWLSNRGVPRQELSPAVIDRVISMATDAATPACVTLPGQMVLHRRRGMISVSQPVVSPTALQPEQYSAFDATRSP